jgi:ubiquitin conjugation factor E4 B
MNIFKVTVDPSREVDSTGHRLTYLPNLAKELADEDAPLKLSIDRLEEAIMEAATAWPAEKPLFDYLLPSWKRVIRAIRLLRGPAPQKEEVLKEARRLCFSNCIFAVTMPELFRYLLV